MPLVISSSAPDGFQFRSPDGWGDELLVHRIEVDTGSRRVGFAAKWHEHKAQRTGPTRLLCGALLGTKLITHTHHVFVSSGDLP
jgi:hypothetical protein